MINQFVSHDDIAAKLPEFTKRFDEFFDKYKTLHSELKITESCNSLLLECVYQLEHNAVSNLQYHWIETLEINPVPLAIQDLLEKTVSRCFGEDSVPGFLPNRNKCVPWWYTWVTDWTKKIEWLLNLSVENINRMYSTIERIYKIKSRS